MKTSLIIVSALAMLCLAGNSNRVRAGVCGDVNADGAVNVGDAVKLINFIFRSGEAPVCEDPTGIQCGASGDCPSGFSCDFATGWCEEDPVCQSDEDCFEGEYCEVATAQCTPLESCGAGGNCPTGFSCDFATGFCEENLSCQSDEDCLEGQYCEVASAQCVPLPSCQSDDDCPGDYICAAGGICFPGAADNDSDGDGYSAPEDCDDSNSSIHPEALEICDYIDNDCDGTTDEGCEL